MKASQAVRLDGYSAVFHTLNALQDAADEAVWVVGTPVYYGVFQEFGTKSMSPNPFLRPAVEDVKRNSLGRILDDAPSLRVAIAQIALRIEALAKHFATTGVPPGPNVKSGRLKSSIKAEQVR